MANALSGEERALIDAYWRAANYLSVGDNPLLKQPLSKEHIKPGLLGHWGTTSGLNFLHVHLNRVIKKYDLDMIYITGPGHRGPALMANAWLEGNYSEVCRSMRDISRSAGAERSTPTIAKTPSASTIFPWSS